jgi:hypothetical protein
LIKKVRKNQDQTMLLPTGLYLGPPFGRAVAFLFLFFFCHPELVEGSVWLGRGFLFLVAFS